MKNDYRIYRIPGQKRLSHKIAPKWCWFLAAALLIAPLTAAEPPGDPGGKKTNTISISLVIPGIAQIKNKQYFKGSLFLAAFVGSAAAAFYYNQKGNSWYDKYRSSTNVEQIIQFRKNTETNLKKRNFFLVSLFSVWLLHLIDLKFFKPGKSGVTGSVGKNEIDIGIYYSF